MKINFERKTVLFFSLIFESLSVFILYLKRNNITPEIVFLSLGLHLTASLITGIYLFLEKKDKSRNVVYFLTSLFFYPLGFFAVFCAHFLRFLNTDKKGIFDDYIDYIKADVQKNISLKKYDDLTSEIKRLSKVQPLVDIIQSDNVILRRAATKRLGDYENRSTVEILKKLLKDSDREVRFYASSSLLKIDENINNRLKFLKNKLSDSPEDIGVLKELGIAYFDYTKLGILDHTTAKYYLKLSLDIFLKAYSIKDEMSIKFFIGRIYIRLKEYNKADKYLSEAIEDKPDDVRSYFWRAESYFAQRKFKELIHDCKKISELGALNNFMKTVIPYWAE